MKKRIRSVCCAMTMLILLLWLPPRTVVRAMTPFSETAPDATANVTLGPAMVTLNGPWKFRAGDSPSAAAIARSPLWAQPDFNDADWKTIDLTPPPNSVDPGLGTTGYIPGWTSAVAPGHAGFAWYRLRVHVEAAGQSLSLLMPIDIDDAYQVYCNGRLVGGFGNFSGKQPRTYYGQPMLFYLPVASTEKNGAADLVLALRFYMKPADLVEDPTPGGLHGPPQLGLAPVAEAYYRLQRNILLRTYNLYSIPILIYFLAGLAAFALFFADRTQRVFLWLGAAGLLNAIYLTFTLSAILTTLVDDRLLILRPVLFSVVLWTWLMTLYTWLELGRVRWLWRAIYGLTALHIALELFQGLVLGRTAFPLVLNGPWEIATTSTSVLIALLPVVMLVYAWREGSPEGKLASFALICLLLAVFPGPLVWLHVPLLWFFAGVQVSTRIMLELAVWIWVFLLFVLRFQQSQRLQHQLQIELRQAQQVQHTLLPEPAATPAGFHVESVYRPAAEVGGDFFQILPAGNDGLLIVVGDVSGKGLRAAMLVSLIVGTLRTLAEQDQSPGELLRGMNRRLHKRMEGGFATCICARIDGHGRMTLANAGHLPPYLDGIELPVPADLPLGIIPELDYEEHGYLLQPDARLVFLTDGIVEARNRKRELYGFDRTRILIRRSISEIVRVAQQFGQEDDVTVVDLVWHGRAVAAETGSVVEIY
jgi:Stage II sporulation protein E (SpoIIE)